MKKFLCWLLRKHNFYSVTSIPSLEDEILSIEGYLDYKCRRCGKMSKGYFYRDRFKTIGWSRLLTDTEKDIFLKDPYIMLNRLPGRR